jgi:hypothetical protein
MRLSFMDIAATNYAARNERTDWVVHWHAHSTPGFL